MKLIVGLGNPGSEYKQTPHNVGFDTIDLLAEQNDGSFRSNKRANARVAKVQLCGQSAWLVKPQTFMNRSGESVSQLMQYYHIALEDLVVVYDDVALQPGRLRIRAKGSSGGHNGLQSIIQQLGDSSFSRIRIGVGRGHGKGRGVIKHVLKKFASEETMIVTEAVDAAAKAVAELMVKPVAETMNQFNGWVAPAAVAKEEAIREKAALSEKKQNEEITHAEEI